MDKDNTSLKSSKYRKINKAFGFYKISRKDLQELAISFRNKGYEFVFADFEADIYIARLNFPEGITSI